MTRQQWSRMLGRIAAGLDRHRPARNLLDGEAITDEEEAERDDPAGGNPIELDEGRTATTRTGQRTWGEEPL